MAQICVYCSAVHCIAVHCSAVQCSAVQCMLYSVQCRLYSGQCVEVQYQPQSSWEVTTLSPDTLRVDLGGGREMSPV